MMHLHTRTINETDKARVSGLYVDEVFECFVLEDPLRATKVDGLTAIPRGEYRIALRTEGGMLEDYQSKFGEINHPGMIWLLDVPNFEWVYIHYGNTPENTEGCLLTGSIYDIRSPDFVGASVAAYRNLYAKVLEAINREEEVTIYVN